MESWREAPYLCSESKKIKHMDKADFLFVIAFLVYTVFCYLCRLEYIDAYNLDLGSMMLSGMYVMVIFFKMKCFIEPVERPLKITALVLIVIVFILTVILTFVDPLVYRFDKFPRSYLQ